MRMALPTIRKLLKNSLPPLRIPFIHSPNPTLIHQPNFRVIEKHTNHTINDIPPLGSPKEESLTHFDSLPFSSIHPFGFFSYPVLSTGLIQDVLNEEDSGIWADSVKKKRKKKMNKHKYKKLRKQLRRQT